MKKTIAISIAFLLFQQMAGFTLSFIIDLLDPNVSLNQYAAFLANVAVLLLSAAFVFYLTQWYLGGYNYRQLARTLPGMYALWGLFLAAAPNDNHIFQLIYRVIVIPAIILALSELLLPEEKIAAERQSKKLRAYAQAGFSAIIAAFAYFSILGTIYLLVLSGFASANNAGANSAFNNAFFAQFANSLFSVPQAGIYKLVVFGIMFFLAAGALMLLQVRTVKYSVKKYR